MNTPEPMVTIFYTSFLWFVCVGCNDAYVLSQYGEWLESNNYQEYVKTLKPKWLSQIKKPKGEKK
tara:strand:- start:605 stop:799 length:195 start_codon:yes stop_codon:yes gene_type:complete